MHNARYILHSLEKGEICKSIESGTVSEGLCDWRITPYAGLVWLPNKPRGKPVSSPSGINTGPRSRKRPLGLSAALSMNGRRALRKGGGQLEALNNRSRRPHKVRQRLWRDEVKAAIRFLRTEHPNLGPD